MLKILNGTLSFKIKEMVGENELWLRSWVSQLKLGTTLRGRGC